MKELVQKVKQWGIDRGLDKVGHLAQAKYTLKETAELLDAYADSDIDKINDAIGDILVTLIVGASNDEELYNTLLGFLSSTESGYDYNKDDIDSEGQRLRGIIYDAMQLIHYCEIEEKEMIFNMYISTAMGLRSFLLHYKPVTLKDCLQLAYNEIKDRTGELNADGHFIKDE